jgi:hypothetical protein
MTSHPSPHNFTGLPVARHYVGRSGMATDRWIRASDQDRQSAVELLSEAYAVGRLRREELDERATSAYSATTCGELRDLTADRPLPVARAGPSPDSVASRHVPPRASQRLVSQMIWMFFNACAGGWCGRASAPRRRVGGRHPDTHRAAADAPPGIGRQRSTRAGTRSGRRDLERRD